jgi:hypothetical protein
MNKYNNKKSITDRILGLILTSPLLWRAVIIVAVFHFMAIFLYSLPVRLMRDDQERDVIGYYQTLERIHNGEDIYAISKVAGPSRLDCLIYNYPPVISSVLAILPTMSFMVFARMWTLLIYLAFWMYAICLARLAIGRITFTGVLVSALALSLFPGTHGALSLGQIDPLLWALFGIALAAPPLQGAGLLAITLVKPWALLPLLWSFKEGRRVQVGTSILFVCAIAIGLYTRGIDIYLSEWTVWFKDILPFLGQGSWAAGNMSISFGALRVLAEFGFLEHGRSVPAWARLWLVFCGAIVPVCVGFMLRKKNSSLQLSAVGCTAIVLSPICWESYLPGLLTYLSLSLKYKSNIKAITAEANIV